MKNVFSLVISHPKIELCFTKNNLTCSTFQNSCFAKFLQFEVFHGFQQVVFHTQNTIFIFHNI